MAEENAQKGNIYSANDTLDINELASLNDDISTEFIEQLQSKIEQDTSEFTGKPISSAQDDSELFEEVANTDTNINVNSNANSDDDFIKKYKAKQNKQQGYQEPTNEVTTSANSTQEEVAMTEDMESKDNTTATERPVENIVSKVAKPDGEIENLTSGNIIEKPIEKQQITYNESLDYLDNNVKYSKYVIYIDPENKEFIESLTVKERKNLINRLLREQDDIAITKRRLGIVQTIIKHSIIAIITLSIAIPVVYWTINASLEASINNYRRSQTIFKTLYREKGKIKTQNKY